MPKSRNRPNRFVPPRKIKLRKHLNADSLILMTWNHFQTVKDPRSRSNGVTVADALQSAFAMFSLKDPSLLKFDERRRDDQEKENLQRVYHIQHVPCDSTMRQINDRIDPDEAVRPLFREVFRRLQRGKAMEEMSFWNGHYLLDLDGTKVFSSRKLSSDFCLEKRTRKSGDVLYEVGMLTGAFVQPEKREVIPVCPEFIRKGDGTEKNDCEQNASARFLKAFRREHPHLRVIVNEDALSANAPHIRLLKALKLRHIIVVKPKDHEFLFEWVDLATRDGKAEEFSVRDSKKKSITHRFRIVRRVPLNASNRDLLVNFVEYWQEEEGEDGTKKVTYHNTWITDLPVGRMNAIWFMRGARARWRIENETFNTLKNQGYHLEHNYGLGKRYLFFIFLLLMMLAFLVDQTQQLCCPLFRAAWKRAGSKTGLWEWMRSLFRCVELDRMETMYRAIVYGMKKGPPQILEPSSG